METVKYGRAERTRPNAAVDEDAAQDRFA